MGATDHNLTTRRRRRSVAEAGLACRGEAEGGAGSRRSAQREAGKEGWVEAGHRPLAGDGGSRRPKGVSNSPLAPIHHLPAEYDHTSASLQEPPKVLPKDRVLLRVREGKAPNTLDGQAKRIASVWCVGAHDDLLHAKVFDRLENPLR